MRQVRQADAVGAKSSLLKHLGLAGCRAFEPFLRLGAMGDIVSRVGEHGLYPEQATAESTVNSTGPGRGGAIPKPLLQVHGPARTDPREYFHAIVAGFVPLSRLD